MPKLINKIVLLLMFLISTVKIYSFDDLPDAVKMQKAAEKAKPCIVLIEVRTSMENPEGGPSYKNITYYNGVILTESGCILTDIMPSMVQSIKVILDAKHALPAIIVGSDEKRRITVLKADSDVKFTPAIFGNSNDVKPGQWLLFVCAMDSKLSYAKLFTYGMFIDYSFELVYRKMILSIESADAMPIGSGSAAFDLEGKVVGLNQLLSRWQVMWSPIDDIKASADEIMKNKEIKYGWLGITTRELSDDYAEYLNISPQGVMVVKVIKDSPAFKAGLQESDIILAVNGVQIEGKGKFAKDEFNRRMFWVRKGENVSLKILRENAAKELTVITGEQPKAKFYEEREYGFMISQIEEYSAYVNKLPIDYGMLVMRVEGGTPAYYANLKQGDIITAVDNCNVKNINDYQEIIEKIRKENKSKIFLQIQRGENKLPIVISANIGKESREK